MTNTAAGIGDFVFLALMIVKKYRDKYTYGGLRLADSLPNPINEKSVSGSVYSANDRSRCATGPKPSPEAGDQRVDASAVLELPTKYHR